MTIPSGQDSRINHLGNGSATTFAYDFKILADSDLEVYVGGVLQTLTTHYSVTGVGETSGGNVEFVSAPGASVSVVIMRAMVSAQPTDLVAHGPFPADTIELMADRATMLIQQIEEHYDRMLGFSASSLLTNPTLPDGVANSLLRWSDTTTLENVTKAELETTLSESNILSGYAKASLPAGATTGQLAFVTDDIKGLWMKAAAQWYQINGHVSDVRDHGAKGDGSTDDTTAFQAAFDAVPADGGMVLIPPPENGSYYKLIDEITITKPVYVRGRGGRPVEIRQATNSKGMFIMDATLDPAGTVPQTYVIFDNVLIRGTPASPLGTAIKVNCSKCQLQFLNSQIWDWTGKGIHFAAATSWTYISGSYFRNLGRNDGSAAIFAEGSHVGDAGADGLVINNNTFVYCAKALYVDWYRSNSIQFRGNYCDQSSTTHPNPGPHVHIEGARQIKITHNHLTTLWGSNSCVYIDRDSGSNVPAEILIMNNTIRGAGAYGIDIKYGNRIVMDANIFEDNTSGSIRVQTTAGSDIYIGPLNVETDTDTSGIDFITDSGTKARGFISRCKRAEFKSAASTQIDVLDERDAAYHWRLLVDATTQLRILHPPTSEATDCWAFGPTYLRPGTAGHRIGYYNAQVRVYNEEVATASLPSPSSTMDGVILVEDGGTGDGNLVIYMGGQRFRIDGGAAF